METQGPFAVKLGGLEKEYARLQSRLRDLNGRDAAAIRTELDGLRRECRQEERLLEHRAAGCRLPAAAELARAAGFREHTLLTSRGPMPDFL